MLSVDLVRMKPKLIHIHIHVYNKYCLTPIIHLYILTQFYMSQYFHIHIYTKSHRMTIIHTYILIQIYIKIYIRTGISPTSENIQQMKTVTTYKLAKATSQFTQHIKLGIHTYF